MATGNKLIRKLKDRGVIQDFHVVAAAKFEKLIYCGFPSSYEVKERIQTSPSPNMHLAWAGFQLAKIPKYEYQLLVAIILYDVTLNSIGFSLGETSRTSAYRRGLAEFCQALDKLVPLLD